MKRVADNRGQALVAVILALALAGVIWETLVIAHSTSLGRLVLQNSLEAGTTTGVAVLADGLNTVAFVNQALLALGIGALLGQGECGYWAAQLRRAQDEVIRRTPDLAKQAAWGTATALGTHWAQFRGAEGRWPSLMVRRVYLLPWLLGQRFPLWIADDLRPVGKRRWGDRVLYLEGWLVSRRAGMILPLRGRAGAAASRSGGGGQSSWPLLATDYDSRLIPSPREGSTRQ
ncbi:MAG: hypothetical protein ACM3XZ_00565 [Betaproteobacteria bacterium]